MNKVNFIYTKDNNLSPQRIEVEAAPRIPLSVLKNLVKDAIAQLPAPQLTSLTIFQENGVYFGQTLTKLPFRLEDTPHKDIHLRVAATYHRTFAKRTRSLGELWTTIQKACPTERVALRLAWNYLLSPLTAFFWRLMCPRQLITDPLDAYRSPHHPAALHEALHQYADILRHQDPSNAWLSTFDQGLLLSGRLGRPETFRDALQELIQRAEPIAIPSGYYENGIFHPVLLYFEPSTNGNMHLTEYGMGEKGRTYAHEFTWTPPDRATIATFLSLYFATAFPSSTPPSSSLESIKRWIRSFQPLRYLQNDLMVHLDQMDTSILTSAQGIQEWRQRLLMASGAQVDEVIFEKRSPHISKSAHKLVEELTATKRTTEDRLDKTTLRMAQFSSQLSLFQQLPAQQKRDGLKSLQEAERLTRSAFKKALGTEAAFAQIIASNRNLAKDYQQYRRLIEQTQQPPSHTELPRLQTQPLSLKTSLHALEQTTFASAAVLPPNPLNAEDIARLERFPNMNFEEITSTLAYFHQRMDQWNGEGRFATSSYVFNRLTPHLPLRDHPLLGPLIARVKADPRVAQQVGEPYITALNTFTQFYWEAKYKLWEFPLDPPERLNILTSTASMTTMSQVLLKTLQKTLNLKNPSTAEPYEEWATRFKSRDLSREDFRFFVGVNRVQSKIDRQHYENLIYRELFQDRYFRYCLDASTLTRIQQIRKIVSPDGDNDKTPFIAIETLHMVGPRRNRQGDVEECHRALFFFDHPGEIPPVLAEPEVLRMWGEEEAQFLPPALTAARYHRIYFSTLLSPETQLYQHSLLTRVFKSGWRMVRQVTSLIKENTGNNPHAISEIKDGYLKDSMQENKEKIASFPRLRLSRTFFSEKFRGRVRAYQIEGVLSQGNAVPLLIAGGRGERSIGVNSRWLTEFEQLSTWKNAGKATLDPPVFEVGRHMTISKNNTMEANENEWLHHEMQRLQDQKFSSLEWWNLDILEKRYEILFDIADRYQIPDLFVLALQKPHLLNHRTFLCKIYLAFFQPQALSPPDPLANPLSLPGEGVLLPFWKAFFQKNGEPIQELIQSSIEKGHLRRALFLLMLCQQIHGMIPQTPDSLPSFATSFRINGEAITAREWMQHLLQNPSISANLQVDIATYLILDSASRPVEVRPNEILPMLHLLQKLIGGAFNATIPAMAIHAEHWLDYHYLPALQAHIKQLPTADLSTLLAAWILQQEGVNLLPGEWRWREHAPLLESGQEPHMTSIDFTTLRILQVNGNPVQGIMTKLPAAIVNSPLFQQAFPVPPENVRMVPSGAKMVFTFQDSDGHPIRLFYDRAQNTFTIEKTFSAAELQAPQAQTFHFVSAESNATDLSTLETRIMEEGYWLNSHNRNEGLFFLHAETPLRIYLKNGAFRKIETWKEGRPVLNTLKPPLLPLPSERVIILQNRFWSRPHQIALLQTGITLQKENGHWKVSGGSFNGYKWTAERTWNHPSFTALFTKLRERARETTLVLESPDKSRTQLLFWPHQLLPSQTVHSKREAPLEVTLHADGTVTGTPAAFLYMAYLSESQGLSSQSQYFITLARRSPYNPKEGDVLEEIFACFESISNKSTRSLIGKMRGMLEILRLQKTQSTTPLYNQQKKQRYIHKAAAIATTYMQWWDRHKDKNVHTPEVVDQRARTLTRTEKTEIEGLIAESLQRAVQPIDSIDTLSPDLKTLRVASLSRFETMNPAFPIALLQNIQKGADLVTVLSSMDKPDERLLTYFFQFWNEIIEREWTPQHLIPLFQALEIWNVSMGEATVQKHHIETARRMLLTLASLPREERQNLRFNTGIFLQRKPSFRKTLIETIRRRNPSHPEVFTTFLDPFSVFREKKVPDFIFLHPLPEGSKEDYSFLQEAAKKLDVHREEFSKGRFKAEFQALGIEEATLDPILQATPGSGIPIAPSREETLTSVGKIGELDLLDLTRNQALLQRVKTLEEIPLKVPNLHFETAPLPFSSLQDWQPFFGELSQDNSGQVEALKNMLKQGKEGLETTENEAFLKALLNLKEQRTTLRVINPRDLERLLNTLEAHRELASQRAEVLKSLILEQLPHIPFLPKGLRQAVQQRDVYSNHDLLDSVLEAFQKGTIPDLQMRSRIALFLMYSLQAEQLGAPLHKIVHELNLIDPSQITEHNILSHMLFEHIQAATDLSRFIDKTKEGSLANPRFSSKYLVTGYRKKIITRPSQEALIESLVKNPQQWKTLEMGQGKTTVVLPLVLLLLAEKGTFPVGLVKEELRIDNKGDLESTTKAVAGKSGVEFHFRIEDLEDPIALGEKYEKLLIARSEKGYCLSSISDLAQIEHGLILLDKKRKALYMQMCQVLSNDKWELSALVRIRPTPSQLTEIQTIERQTFWLTKIRDLLRNKNPAVPVAMFADEVDSTLSLIQENNLADGAVISLNPLIREISQEILSKLMTEESFQEIRDAIMKGEQSALSHVVIQGAALLLAKGIYPRLSALFPNEQAFLDYVTGNPKAQVDISWNSKAKEPLLTLQNRLAVYKQILSHEGSLKTALGQSPFLEVAVKKSDGYTVGPQVDGAEKKGNLFGDRFDLVLNLYITYLRAVPPHPFFLEAFQKLQETNTPYYQTLLRAVETSSGDLFTYLNQPENWRARLEFIEKAVVQENRIKRFGEQYVLPVQDLVHQLPVGGMSGTGDYFILPQAAGVAVGSISHDKTVEAKTALAIAHTHLPVKEIRGSDVLQELRKTLNANLETKAVVNAGVAFEGKTNRELVAELRQGSPRVFIFPVPTTEEAISDTMIWRPGEEAPQFIRKSDLYFALSQDPELKRQVLFLFGLSDQRGRDYQIPAGDVIYLHGFNTDSDRFSQAVWRARRLGTQHRLVIWAPPVVLDRIRKRGVSEITWAHILHDAWKIGLEKRERLHHKAAQEKIEVTLRVGARNLPHRSLPLPSTPPLSGETLSLQFLDSLIAVSLTTIIDQHKIILKNKEGSLEAHFAPTRKKETKAHLLEIISLNQNKLRALKQDVEDFLSGAGAHIALIQTIQPGNAQILQERLRIHIYQVKTLFKEMEKEIDYMLQQVTAFEVLGQELSPHLTTGSTPNTQEHVTQQVQQQVQQQQQQQQQIQTQELELQQTGIPKYGKITDYPYRTWVFNSEWNNSSSKRILGTNGVSIWPNTILVLSNGIRISDPARNLLTFIPRFNGDPSVVRFLVKDGQILVLSQQDLQFAVTPGDVHAGIIQGSLYAFGNQAEPPLLIASSSTDPIPLREYVQLKILLGYHQFGPLETGELERWYGQLRVDRRAESLDEFLIAHGTQDQLDLLYGLFRQPSRAVTTTSSQ